MRKRRILNLAIVAAMSVSCLGGFNLSSRPVYALDESKKTKKELNSELKKLENVSVDDLVKNQCIDGNVLLYNVGKDEPDRWSHDFLCVKKGKDKASGGIMYLEDGTEVELGPNEPDPSIYFDLFVAGENSCFAKLNSGDEVSVEVSNKKTGEKFGVFEAKLVDMCNSDFYNQLVKDPLIEKAKNVGFVKDFRNKYFEKVSNKYPKFLRLKMDNGDEKFKFTDPNSRIDETHVKDYAYNFTFYGSDDAVKAKLPLAFATIWC